MDPENNTLESLLQERQLAEQRLELLNSKIRELTEGINNDTPPVSINSDIQSSAPIHEIVGTRVYLYGDYIASEQVGSEEVFRVKHIDASGSLNSLRSNFLNSWVVDFLSRKAERFLMPNIQIPLNEKRVDVILVKKPEPLPESTSSSTSENRCSSPRLGSEGVFHKFFFERKSSSSAISNRLYFDSDCNEIIPRLDGSIHTSLWKRRD